MLAAYYFLAYIKYDFFERKFLNTSPNYRDCLTMATSYGLSQNDKIQLFGILKPVSYQWSLIIHLIISGIFAIIFILHLIANDHSAETIKRHEQEVYFVKDCSSRVSQLIGKSKDKATDKAIEKLYDLIHSSPSKSNSSARIIENNISILINNLCEAVNSGDSKSTLQIVKQIQQSVDERNRRIKTSQ